MSSNISPDVLKSLFGSVIRIEHEPASSEICLKKDLLSHSNFKVTTYLKYRIELKKKYGPDDCHTAEFYATVSVNLAGEVLYRNYKDGCVMSFRISDDSGLVANVPLKPVVEFLVDPNSMFEKVLAKRKLKGKFNLEVLFVDSSKVSDRELFEKYVAIINNQMENPSDSSLLKEKVLQAEMWLPMAIKRKESDDVETVASPKNIIAKRPFDIDLVKLLRFPQEGKLNHMFLVRYHISFPDDIWLSNTDRPALYAQFAMMIYEKYCSKQVIHNTHTMFEILTNDGHLILTKLRPYSEATVDMITATIKNHRIPRESFIGLFTVAVYCVDLPDFATPWNAPSRIGLIRKALEKKMIDSDCDAFRYLMEKGDKYSEKKFTTFANLDQCMKPAEIYCNCKRLHLSDYCSAKLLLEKKSSNISMQRWSIVPSDFAVRLFEGDNASDLYIIIANRISVNLFCLAVPKSGTNIMVEMEICGKKYSSQLKYHTDLFTLFNEDSFGLELNLSKEVIVTLYVVEMFNFASDKEANDTLSKFRQGNYEISSASGNSSMESNFRQVSKGNSNISSEGFEEAKKRAIYAHETLDTTIFKPKTLLGTRAKIEPLLTRDSYKILSTKTTLSTNKSKIILFLIEVDSKFFSEVLNSTLLMANICLDIIKNNQELLKEKNKITVKFHLGNNVVQVLLNEANFWNAHILMADVCEESIGPVEMPKEFYLEVNYRSMHK